MGRRSRHDSTRTFNLDRKVFSSIPPPRSDDVRTSGTMTISKRGKTYVLDIENGVIIYAPPALKKLYKGIVGDQSFMFEAFAKDQGWETTFKEGKG